MQEALIEKLTEPHPDPHQPAATTSTLAYRDSDPKRPSA